MPVNKIKDFDIRSIKSAPQSRNLEFSRSSINEESRTVELSFASETDTVERWYGVEILDCRPGSVRLGRLNNGAPLLFNHDKDRHLGIIEGASLDTDRKARAQARFGRGEEASEKFQDVLDGILTKVSVVYMIHEAVLEREVDGVPHYRITDWEPYEISMVTIPADDTVGVGRGLEFERLPDKQKIEVTLTETRESGFFNVQIKEHTMPVAQTLEELEAQGRQLAAQMGEQKVEQARRDALVDIGVKYANYLTMDDVKRAVDEKQTPYQLQELVIQRQTTKHADTSGHNIGMEKKDVANYSIAKAVRAIVMGDWKDAGLERAAAEACGARFGDSVQFTGRNLVVPFDVFSARDFTAGTAAEAGNLVATDLRGDLFADVLRNRLALGNLGVTMLYGLSSNIDIPRKTVGMSLGWLAETAAATETQPTTAKVTLSPKRIGGFVEFSKQGVIQSAMAIEPMLRQDLLSEYAVQVENAAINGSGAGVNPRGIRNVSGIGSVIGGTNGAQLDWGHIVGLESAVANVNAEPDVNSGYLINTKTRGWAKQTLKAAGFQQFLWDNGPQPLNGYRAEVTNNVLSNLTKGTANGICSSAMFSSMWDMLVIGTFGAIELTLDDLTLAPNGMNRLILNAYIDVGCRRPANFSVMDDVLTA